MSGRLRAALQSGALLAASLLVALGAGELLLRAFRPQTLGFSWQRDDGLWVHVPGREGVYRRSEFAARVAFNELGFRGGPFEVPKPPDTLRILALGDSFTEGLQVEADEVFTARIEAAFAGTRPRVEVLNLGVSGYGTDDALYLLRAHGAALEPDLVVLFFCLANDVVNNLYEGRCRLEAGELACAPAVAPRGLERAVSRMKSYAATHSHLYQILRAATTAPIFRRLGLRKGSGGERGAADAADLYRDPPPEWLAEGLELTAALLRALRDEAASLGAETWLVLVPIREQVEDRRWRALEAASDGALRRDRPQRSLRALGEAVGLRVIDLWPAFRAREEAGEHLYWRIDGHFDPVGHEVTADVVARALRASLGRGGSGP